MKLMSNIKINRFEKKEVKPNIDNNKVIIKNNTTILIKDHSTDQIISLVQLTNDINKNKDLADRVITAIEEYILENEDATENQQWLVQGHTRWCRCR